MKLRNILSGLLAGFCLAGFTPSAPPPPPFQLRGDVQVFPRYLINKFPFIEGKLMA